MPAREVLERQGPSRVASRGAQPHRHPGLRGGPRGPLGGCGRVILGLGVHQAQAAEAQVSEGELVRLFPGGPRLEHLLPSQCSQRHGRSSSGASSTAPVATMQTLTSLSERSKRDRRKPAARSWLQEARKKAPLLPSLEEHSRGGRGRARSALWPRRSELRRPTWTWEEERVGISRCRGLRAQGG